MPLLLVMLCCRCCWRDLTWVRGGGPRQGLLSLHCLPARGDACPLQAVFLSQNCMVQQRVCRGLLLSAAGLCLPFCILLQVCTGAVHLTCSCCSTSDQASRLGMGNNLPCSFGDGLLNWAVDYCLIELVTATRVTATAVGRTGAGVLVQVNCFIMLIRNQWVAARCALMLLLMTATGANSLSRRICPASLQHQMVYTCIALLACLSDPANALGGT